MKYKSRWRRDHGWGEIKIKIKMKTEEGMVALVVWTFKPLVCLSICLCCECSSESRCFRSFACLFPFLKKQQKQKPAKKRGEKTPTQPQNPHCHCYLETGFLHGRNKKAYSRHTHTQSKQVPFPSPSSKYMSGPCFGLFCSG